MRVFTVAAAMVFILAFPPAVFSEGSSDLVAVAEPASNGRISVDLRGIDIVEALKILSARGNLNMVIGGNIQGRVTLFLKDVDIQDALNIVLVSSGLAYDKKGGILYVMTQRDYEQIYGESFIGEKSVRVFQLKYAKAANLAKSVEQAKTRLGKLIVDDVSNSLVVMDSPASMAQIETIIDQIDQPIESRILQLKYAKAEDIKTKVVEMTTKDVGTVEIDARTNKISVTDIPSRLDEIEKVVKAFDEEPRQVLIEAKIVQVTLTDEYKLGVDWQGIFTKIQKDYSFRSNFKIAAAGAFPSDTFQNGGEVMIGNFGRDDYAMLIQALKTVGDTNLLSSPRITALNNQEAKILVGESRPYATNTVIQPASGATTTASTLSFLDIGIKLYVTPSVSEDNFITMKIKPEVSSSSSNYTYGDPATTVPIISTTQAETSVRIKDGSTIIIAGLIKDERSGDVSKVPVAGDIPILGNLFKKTDKTVAKQELVIFITPRVISGEQDYFDMSSLSADKEKRFTVPEENTFERRYPEAVDPGYFKTPPSALSQRAVSTDLTKISNPATLEEYYYSIKDRILGHIDLGVEGSHSIHGDVQISFIISSKGEMLSEPIVRRASGPEIIPIALRAVKAASPFPPFPSPAAYKQKEFTMDFVFE